MTNTSTMDTMASVEQCIRIIEAGADYVRLTAQGEREAVNLAMIHEELRNRGYQTPLIADIHFNPKAADEAALHVEKVRINPGNYVDSVKTFKHFEYSDEEYAAELKKVRDRFVPFLNICKSHHTAIRIGVNHGSLSDRIMSRYGDTPSGMVESCMEFLRICVEEDFPDVVISIKASNTLVMVQTVRLLVVRMQEEGMCFPLHLGVTEAGDGEDGRIKSAIGIGTLLLDGIGDTIRVSLSEDPEREVPVARALLDNVSSRSKHPDIRAKSFESFDPFSYHRRMTIPVGSFGGNQVPVVISDVSKYDFDFSESEPKPDFVYVGTKCSERKDGIKQLCDLSAYAGQEHTFPVVNVQQLDKLDSLDASMIFLSLEYKDLCEKTINQIKSCSKMVLLPESHSVNSLFELRALFHSLLIYDCVAPAVLCSSSFYPDHENMQIGLSLDFGPLLLDGFGDGLMYRFPDVKDTKVLFSGITGCLFGILQASRLRMIKTEYISCPSCGRTMFDLQKTIARIKAKTSHLKGLKIGIMGCIVNGPGEMADADYGYVGAGKGKITLYKKKEIIKKNIPQSGAVEALIALIKESGDWKEK
jgi:(E)-4-hydroxy-3-methylbut-2-enyl-diphosphate synthase